MQKRLGWKQEKLHGGGGEPESSNWHTEAASEELEESRTCSRLAGGEGGVGRGRQPHLHASPIPRLCFHLSKEASRPLKARGPTRGEMLAREGQPASRLGLGAGSTVCT